LATESKIQKNFRTITPFSLDTYQPIYSKIDFQLNFSHKVKSEDLAKYLKISPEISAEKWAAYTKKWTEETYESNYFYLNTIDNSWTPNQEYRVSINEELSDIYGRKLSEKYEEKFTTIFQDEIYPLYLPDHYSVFDTNSDPKFVFKYTGSERNLNIELSRKLPNSITEKYDLLLTASQDKESVFEIDLAKNFSKIFPEEKISPGKYEIKIFKEGQRWPKRSAIFYISDFAVGIKDFADERFQILAENFDGSPINGVSEKIEIWANNELQKTLTDFDLWEIINTLSIIGSST